ncbi:MAG: aminotransferase class III-fold pyridoxal phosphate-dependent enzyme [Rhodococcus fascians]
MGRFWHPFADMAAVRAGGELVLRSGDGVWLHDIAGRKFLDATAAAWYANVGYGRTEIAAAISDQAGQLHAYHCYADVVTETTLTLVDKLVEIAPVPDSAVFLTSGGSDSVDTALKMIQTYWHARGRHDKKTIVTRTNSYHGMHWGGTSLAGIEPNRAGYDDLLNHTTVVAWDDPTVIDEAVERAGGADQVAAFFCEPVIGAGGVFPPPPGYLSAVRDACRRHDIVFVADEVITGFGRVGDWFASTRFDLAPDITLSGKGITSGYAPLGAVLVAPHVADVVWSPSGPGVWRHGYTYSGHATAAAAALANIAIMEREDLPARSLALEHTLAERLTPLAQHPLVAEVRSGTGVMAAIQLDPGADGAGPDLGRNVVASLREKGVLTRLLPGDALHVSPPLIIDDAEISTLVDHFWHVLADHTP